MGLRELIERAFKKEYPLNSAGESAFTEILDAAKASGFNDILIKMHGKKDGSMYGTVFEEERYHGGAGYPTMGMSMRHGPNGALRAFIRDENDNMQRRYNGYDLDNTEDRAEFIGTASRRLISKLTRGAEIQATLDRVYGSPVAQPGGKA